MRKEIASELLNNVTVIQNELLKEIVETNLNINDKNNNIIAMYWNTHELANQLASVLFE